MTFTCIENPVAPPAQQGQCPPGFEMRNAEAMILVSAELPPPEIMTGSVVVGFMIAFSMPRVVSFIIGTVVEFFRDL